MRARRPMTSLCLTVLALASLHAQSSVTELNDAGWKELRNGNGDRAEALFARALTLRPNDPVLVMGSGASAQAQGHHREAMLRLQRALDLEPRLTVASQLLGQIAYDEGEVDLAIRTLEKALKYAPNDPELAGKLDAWRREAEVHHSFEERRY